MLDQLRAILETEEFEHDGEIRLITAVADDAKITFQFDIDCGLRSGRKAELWQIECLQPLSYRLLSEDWDWSGTFDLVDDHPLLWAYTYQKRELHLKEKPRDVVRMAWLLYERHLQVTKGWFSFETFLNQNTLHGMDLLTLLKGGYGILAQGPIPLLKEYAAVLAEQGVATYYYPG